MAKHDLQSKGDLRSISRADFLYHGQPLEQWTNPVESFIRWRNYMWGVFLILLSTTAVQVVWHARAESESLWVFFLAVEWVVAGIVLSWIRSYLENGIFEQEVRTAFMQARSSLSSEERLSYLGHAFELVKNSPVIFQRMRISQPWASGPDNPDSFDWILARLRDAGIFIHEAYPLPGCKNLVQAADNRYKQAIDQLIGKLDALKERWILAIDRIQGFTVGMIPFVILFVWFIAAPAIKKASQ